MRPRIHGLLPIRTPDSGSRDWPCTSNLRPRLLFFHRKESAMKLRNMATAILFLSSVSLCSAAVPPEFRNRPGDKAQLSKGSAGPNSPQTGGDNIGNATVIPSLPYTDTGGTCGATDDYTPSCFFSGAPDVVYAYTPTVTEAVTISLCVGSNYDTGLYV